MNTQKTNTLGPFIVITFIYFIVGFLTTVNGQFQGPMKIAFLSEAGALRNTLTTLISFFFALGYLLNSTMGGRWINKFGYKKTLMRALFVMTSALLTYLLSSWFTVIFGTVSFEIAGDHIPYGYLIFLLGSYLMGTSAALSQVVINPYVAAYDLPGTQPVQRMNIVCAINSFGTTIAPFFVTGVIFAGIALEDVQIKQLLLPFTLLALFVIITTVITSRMNLPDIKDTRADASEDNGPMRSIWSFRHLALGVITIFFYVGGETSIGVNVNLHAMELIEKGEGLTFFGNPNLEVGGVNLGIPALLATLYWGGLMIGRMVSSFLTKISARTQLTVTTSIAAVLAIIAMCTNNLWILVSIGLCHSVMWGCIFTLAIQGLKKYTSKASGVFMMGVFGGAVFPLLQGYMADQLGSWQWTWIIVVICEIVMLCYAQFGSRIKTAELVEAG
jgi:FHS family L-fucose permease-like MFS transporter